MGRHDQRVVHDVAQHQRVLRSCRRGQAVGLIVHADGARDEDPVVVEERAQLPVWLRALDVQLDTHQMQRLMHLDDGTVLCNAALTARTQACLARIHAEDAEAPAFAPLFQARAIELLTYVLLDLAELLRPARSADEAGLPEGVAARRARNCIDERPAHAWTVAALAGQAGCSEAQLQRGFRAGTGQSVHQYLRAARLDLAARLLRETQLSVQQVAQESGWQCHGRFGAAFRERHGQAPLLYRLQKA